MTYRLGILGGTGALGGAIARGLIRSGRYTPAQILLVGRRGQGGLADHPDLAYSDDIQRLNQDCAAVLLSVPPQQAGQIRLGAPGPVLSVMAGIPIASLQRIAGTDRVIRAMSSPAAADGLAYSPWVAAPGATQADRALAAALLSAIGASDELTQEAHLDVFTAITGPVPGFVALFAEAMAAYARDQGVAQDVAERAVRQLFKASGAMLGADPAAPADQVQAMIDYAGTTAAGLTAMQEAGLQQVVSAGLEAAVAKARALGQDAG